MKKRHRRDDESRFQQNDFSKTLFCLRFIQQKIRNRNRNRFSKNNFLKQRFLKHFAFRL